MLLKSNNGISLIGVDAPQEVAPLFNPLPYAPLVKPQDMKTIYFMVEVGLKLLSPIYFRPFLLFGHKMQESLEKPTLAFVVLNPEWTI